MTTASPLDDLVGLLDRADVAYMVVGSIASTFHGPPRTTVDIDVVIEVTPTSLTRLLALVDGDRYHVPESARAGVRPGEMFNIVDYETGWKFDLIVRKERSFSREELARRRTVRIGELRVSIASPEDTVLSKLEWASHGGSDRQVADAASVLAVIGSGIDDQYLNRWASELGVEHLLALARQMAGGNDPP